MSSRAVTPSLTRKDNMQYGEIKWVHPVLLLHMVERLQELKVDGTPRLRPLLDTWLKRGGLLIVRDLPKGRQHIELFERN